MKHLMEHFLFEFHILVSISPFGLLLCDCAFVHVIWFYLVFADLLAT